MFGTLEIIQLFSVIGALDLGGGLDVTKEQVGNALAMGIGIVALVYLFMGRIGKMIGFLVVAGIVWVVVGDPKGFLSAMGELFKAIFGL
ncbi:TPA: TcpD family membrane protein [Staphylococcus aureus]|uniref:TcpD family membrane protein n=1 Tax=Staphylococcus aureus TaxID=1280 RepID=UPI0015789E18|nr:TcpD family membrane protein [Staphylococcus aureus]MBB2534452.1 hypothetical protein [Staphylococcus aureus]CAC8081088.1 Uncharacterised protein [Staphylococcus aureus]HDD7598737.1 hypothetical protein [Staphylococcus aureus]HDE0230093.1 hypothetical protein [Staphylococcus aureus]HDE0243773.1 hypothetical protein [Staphylococcus aureus]